MGELGNEGMNRPAGHLIRLNGYSVENGMEFEGRNANREASDKVGARAMLSGNRA